MKPSKKPVWISVGAVVVVAALLFWFFAKPSMKAPADAEQLAPEITLPDVNGKKVSLSSYRGKVVFLDFWATWCEPCLEELPDLIRFQQAHKSEPFTILGVAMDAEGVSVVGPFVQQNKIPYPILVSNGDLPDGYPIPGFPSAFLIDAKGHILRRYLGPIAYDELERDVAQAEGR